MASLLVGEPWIRLKVGKLYRFFSGERRVLADKNVRLCTEQSLKGQTVIAQSLSDDSFIEAVEI